MSTIDKPDSSAKQTFGTVKSNKNKRKKKLGKSVKEWFDGKCKVERQNYRKLKRKYHVEKSITNRENMKI